jgi:hypothetical protein
MSNPALTVTRNGITETLVQDDYKKGDKVGAKYYNLPSIRVEGNPAQTEANLERRKQFLGIDLVAGILDARTSQIAQKIASAHTKYVVNSVEETGPDGKVTKKDVCSVVEENLPKIQSNFTEMTSQAEKMSVLKETQQLLAEQITKLVLVNPDNTPNMQAIADFQRIGAEMKRIMAVIAAKSKDKDDSDVAEDDTEAGNGTGATA